MVRSFKMDNELIDKLRTEAGLYNKVSIKAGDEG
jgi:hypothetical protein